MSVNDWGSDNPYEQMNEQYPAYNQDVAEEIIDDDEVEQDTGSVVSEALKRIEQAKLYESLLRHPLFAPGSARPEIMNAVQDEIRAFILERLETLVGLRHPKVVKNSSEFSEDQIGALRVLADRMIQKNNESKVTSPQVMPLQTKEQVVQQPLQVNPVVQPLPAPAGSSANIRRPTPQAQRPVAKRKTVAKQPAAPAPSQEPAQPGEEKVKHRQGQVVSKTHRPLPMPNFDQTAQLHAAETSRTSANLQTSQNGLTQLLNLAVMDAQNKNRNVQEE